MLPTALSSTWMHLRGRAVLLNSSTRAPGEGPSGRMARPNVLSRFLSIAPGEVAEWFKAAVLKTAVPKGTGGSNPSLSVTVNRCHRVTSLPIPLP